MSRKKKPEVIIPEPPADHPFVADAPVVLSDDPKPIRIGSANAVITCPTCGTAKAGNRCDVCGHQEKDT